MILSNVEILRCLQEGLFAIDNLAGDDPAQAPFNTSAIDLRLGEEIVIPQSDSPVQLDLTNAGIASFGPYRFLLTPEMYICQLIIEEVKGRPAQTSN